VRYRRSERTTAIRIEHLSNASQMKYTAHAHFAQMESLSKCTECVENNGVQSPLSVRETYCNVARFGACLYKGLNIALCRKNCRCFWTVIFVALMLVVWREKWCLLAVVV